MKTALYRTELIMRLFLPEDESQEKVLHIRQELQVGENQWMPKFQDKREETCNFNINSSINPTKQVWQNNMILLSGFQFDTWTYDNTMTNPITVLVNRKGTYYNVVFLINCIHDWINIPLYWGPTSRYMQKLVFSLFRLFGKPREVESVLETMLW